MRERHPHGHVDAPDSTVDTGTTSTSCEAAGEVCNGADDDCDGLVDDEDPSLTSAPTWYGDGDGDGFGDGAHPVVACVAAGLADGSDCDDGDPAVHPDAAEICDTVDTDCDGFVSDDPNGCVEGFEGIGDGNLQTPYLFASGVGMVDPDPNRSDSSGVIVVDCQDGGGFFGFGCDLGVPEGSAALGTSNLGLFFDWRFVFPDLATDVSVLFAASNSDLESVFTFTAYDAAGAVLDSDSGRGTVADWANNRLSVSSPLGIAGVVLTGDGGGSILADSLSWR